MNYGNLFVKKTQKSSLDVKGTIIFEGITVIFSGFNIKISPNATLTIGHGFELGCNANIFVSDCVSFGEDCMLSWNVTIMDTDMHRILDRQTGRQINYKQKVTIGSHVWIGCNSTILKGVSISDGCVVAANSLITNDVECKNSIIKTGSKVIRTDVEWSKPLYF